ncbi:MAG TPA: NADH-quinone oxidoreductase subunit NuoK [bacterium]|jgi:NADH-quinone oxidoreductase subunit K|nr:NADH-quinone oxidoreductase subunit NuoK [bacterium]
MPTVEISLVLAAAVFCVGACGVLLRRDPLVMFICIEMMFNAANLAFVALSDRLKSVQGQTLVFLVIAVAAAEVAVGLSIIIAIFRTEKDVNVDHLSELKG